MNRIVLTAAILAGLSTISGPATAGNGNLKSISLELNAAGVIHVVSEDGQTWSKLKPTQITLAGTAKAKMWTGYILAYHLRLGSCSGEQCYGPAFPVIYGPNNLGLWEMKFEKNVSVTIDTGIAPVSTTGISANGDYDAIIGKCNALLAQGKSIRENHVLSATMHVTLGIETKGVAAEFSPGGAMVDFRDVDAVPVSVICEGAPLQMLGADTIATPPVPFKVTDAKLFLTTFQAPSLPTPGEACKTLRVKARFKTTKPGLVHFDLSRKVGDDPLAVIPITIEAKQKADGTFEAEYVKDWFLRENTYAQFFVQVTDDPFGPNDGWEDINVICGGGLAGTPPVDPDAGPALKVLKSSFQVTTFKNDSLTGCPAKAALDVEFVTNKPGSVPFKVTGNDGFVWNASIKAEEQFGPIQIGNGQAQYQVGYRAKFRRMIDVTKTTHALYGLEVRNVAAEPSARNAGPDNLEVVCGGSLQVGFQVTQTELSLQHLPNKGCPTKVFAIATFITNQAGNIRYRMSSDNGAVDTGTLQSKKIGSTFRAVHTLTIDVTKGGNVLASAMPLDFPTKVALAKLPVVCKAPAPASGDLTIAPPTTHNAKPKAKLVIIPPPLTCSGGTVRKGVCVCPAKVQPVKTAANKYRCLRSTPAKLIAPPTAKKPLAATKTKAKILKLR